MSDAEIGLMLTLIGGGGAATVTVAVANLVLSATLVARTVNVPAVAGAVYRPPVETVPPVADQVTAVLLVPVTVAVNCCVPPVSSEADVGLIPTETSATFMVAEADFVGSAALVAVTVNVPTVLGAVYSPLVETAPPVADQVTAVLLVPLTVAVNC